MKAKYNMTVEQNIFVAKKYIVQYVYNSAKLEGLGVTFPDTQTIFDGVSVEGLPVHEVIAVNNLKRTWYFLFDTLEPPLDYVYLCKLNQLVGGDDLISNAGYIRTLPVRIGGTEWAPAMPTEDGIKAGLAELEQIESPTLRAIKTMLYCMRGQFYLDGNKRTAMLAANKVMIENGCGVITVTEKLVSRFNPLLVEYYETGNDEKIVKFIYDNCIDGMPFEN